MTKTKTITSIVDDELRSLSPFGEEFTQQVRSALQVDFSKLGLPGYNDLVLALVRAKMPRKSEQECAVGRSL